MAKDGRIDTKRADARLGDLSPRKVLATVREQAEQAKPKRRR